MLPASPPHHLTSTVRPTDTVATNEALIAAYNGIQLEYDTPGLHVHRSCCTQQHWRAALEDAARPQHARGNILLVVSHNLLLLHAHQQCNIAPSGERCTSFGTVAQLRPAALLCTWFLLTDIELELCATVWRQEQRGPQEKGRIEGKMGEKGCGVSMH